MTPARTPEQIAELSARLDAAPFDPCPTRPEWEALLQAAKERDELVAFLGEHRPVIGQALQSQRDHRLGIGHTGPAAAYDDALQAFCDIVDKYKLWDMESAPPSIERHDLIKFICEHGEALARAVAWLSHDSLTVERENDEAKSALAKMIERFGGR